MPRNPLRAKGKESRKKSASEKSKKARKAVVASTRGVTAKKVKKIVKKAIDGAIPDTVITTHKTTSYNSGIGAGDTGYLFKAFDEGPVGGLYLAGRICILKGFATSARLNIAITDPIRCKSLYYHGSFHINPAVFGDSPGVQNNMVRVHCFILSDKYNKEGNDRTDRNCVNDLLLQKDQLWPNTSGGYAPDNVNDMMIPFSGTMLDENLPINRRRFKVIKHKTWDISPTSATYDTIDTTPNVSVSGKLTRKFKFRIPTPKRLVWDRRKMDAVCSDGNVQTPVNVGDPFVCWGYTPYPQTGGPDVLLTNLVVDAYTTIRLEIPDVSAVE